MKFAFLGANLETLYKGHSILDKDPSSDITVYTEDAEAGFSEHPHHPIILNDLVETIPSDWYGRIPDSVNRENKSSTSSSWLVKALSIRLAERGANFLLHTRIIEIDDENQEIHFRGGGSNSSGIHPYDQLYDFRQYSQQHRSPSSA